MMKNNSSCNDVASSNMFSEESDTPVVHLSALNKYWNAKCLAFNQEKRDEQNQLRLVNVSPETLAWNRIALQQHILAACRANELSVRSKKALHCPHHAYFGSLNHSKEFNRPQ